jgi:ribosomal protein S18 acetylase RimI-like enzyme
MISDFSRSFGDLCLTHSQVESNRFGINVSRLNVPLESPSSDIQIAQICSDSSADLLILRYPSARISLSQRLAELSKKYAFQADTLVYFSKNLDSKTEHYQPVDGLKFSVASAGDKSSIQALSQEIFQDYPNHYRSNRHIEPRLILDGYVEWALSGLEDSTKLTLIVATPDSKMIGFALVSFDNDEAEIELNGVHPDFQSRGVYSALLQMLIGRLVDQKIKKLSISTQVQNIRVIRAWVKVGFNLDFSLNTFHVISRKS